MLVADHVLPKSRGGPHTLENMVAACVRCNNRKGVFTPAEAGMVLLSRIDAQRIAQSHAAVRVFMRADLVT